MLRRCDWATNDRLIEYHDTEWGVPCRDDQKLFEFLTLEGAQAGLSWDLILSKRAGYREAFAQFDVNQVAKLNDQNVEHLLKNPAIIRNRRKITSAINNAQVAKQIQLTHGSLSDYLWALNGGRPIHNHWSAAGDVPSASELSTAISQQLKRQGFQFIGPVIYYSFMQAVGMVYDHTTDCFRHRQLKP